jgi:general secretion pathway protein J
MVALFIFAVLGMIGTQLVSRVTQQQGQLADRGARLGELQRAMQILKRDFMQIQNRPIRDGLGDLRPSLVLAEDIGLEFTRLGWRNPLRQPRSDEQRVAYLFDEGENTLIRLFWPVLDRAQDSEPVRQVLLTRVDRVEFLVVGSDGNRFDYWPQVTAPVNGPAAAAIELRIDAAPFGRIDRIWEVPAVQ